MPDPDPIPSSPPPPPAGTLTERVREACVQAALDGYEDAAMRGLCHEGAWEAAISAIRRVELPAGDDAAGPPIPRRGGGLHERTVGLAERFAEPGAPATGSAAAATGAIAAGLLQWVAERTRESGPMPFRKRARTIAGRAEVLRGFLATAGHEDAEIANALLRVRSARVRRELGRGATDSAVTIATRAAQVALLAAEIAGEAPDAAGPDARAIVRLARTAADTALGLVDENLRGHEGEAWFRDARRGAWRAALLVQRATRWLEEDGTATPGREADDAPAEPG